MKKINVILMINSTIAVFNLLMLFFCYRFCVDIKKHFGFSEESIRFYNQKTGNVFMKVGTLNEHDNGLLIMDNSGVPRTCISLSEDGDAEFAIFDRDGDTRTKVASYANGNSTVQVVSSEGSISTESRGELGPSITFADKTGKPILKLYSDYKGERGLSIHAKNGNDRMVLNVNKDDEPGSVLYGPDMKYRLGFGVKKSGSVGFEFQDANAHQRLGIGLQDSGDSYVQLSDDKGLARTSISEQLFYITDEKGTARIGILVDKNLWSGLTLFPSTGGGRLSIGAGRDSQKEIVIYGKNNEQIYKFDSNDLEGTDKKDEFIKHAELQIPSTLLRQR